MLINPECELDRRRQALLSAGIDADLVLAAETASRPHPAPVTQVAEIAASQPRPEPPDPAPYRSLDDYEWNLIADLLPDDPRARLSSRRFIDTMIAVVIGGLSWRGAQGERFGAVRERHRRERERVELWSEIERRAMLMMNSPQREHVVRVARFIKGQYNTRAKRPRPHMKRASKFSTVPLPSAATPWASQTPKSAEPALPHHYSRVRRRRHS